MRELPRSIREAADLLRKRELSAVELAEASRIAAHTDSHNAWLHMDDEHSRRQARAADERLGRARAAARSGRAAAGPGRLRAQGDSATWRPRTLDGRGPAESRAAVSPACAAGAPCDG